ncbi:hypothetical protein DF209_21405 [Pectobacterium polaris]|nr:hypothetical protein DF209_21405 [Pectobacterium polaris]
MKVGELRALLAEYDQDATVLIAGFETQASVHVAEVDMVTECKSLSQPEDAMLGNRAISVSGDSSVWIGWSKDYRTENFLHAVADPENYS